MRTKMKKVEIFKEELDGQTLIYIPETDKVYIVDNLYSNMIPDWIEVKDEEITWKSRTAESEKSVSDLVLLLTTKCNMSCNYCYSDAGVDRHSMTAEIASNSINYVLESVKKSNHKGFSVLFHGEGEPTLSWQVLTESLEYAREKARESNIIAKFSLATNGLYGLTKRTYISQNFNNVTISMDGPKDITDEQRPRRDGKSSFTRAFESAQYFYKLKDQLNFGIRMTLLPENISRLPEIVKFFGSHFPGIQLSVEPVEYIGRYSNKPRESFKGFAFAYLEAKDIAKKYDLHFWYSAVRGPRASKFFCGVAGRSMVVGPTGLISGCSRVSQWKHEGSSDFIYGTITAKELPVIDQKIKSKLENYSVDNMSDCKGCIAETWCRGDCRHIRYVANGSVIDGVSSRCKEIRTIVVGELLNSVDISNTDHSVLTKWFYDNRSGAHAKNFNSRKYVEDKEEMFTDLYAMLDT